MLARDSEEIRDRHATLQQLVDLNGVAGLEQQIVYGSTALVETKHLSETILAQNLCGA
jgi:hypothetical protein